MYVGLASRFHPLQNFDFITYGWYIVGGVALAFADALMIFELFRLRAKHRKIENALIKSLRETEQRFRLVADTAPVMIWMAGVDKLCTYLNRRWLEFSGRTLEQEMGNGWAEGVHAEDISQCLDAYTHACDQRESFQIQYRLRRNDGEYRWIIDSGVPRFDADGSFAGYIGSAIDITERKLAEDALSMVSRKLIEAHEQERAWLARELHDDISQRLCLLLLTLANLKSADESPVELRYGIGNAMQDVSSIATDTQRLSHRLHSSKLEVLGLSKAAAGYCGEVADQYKVEIDLWSENITRDLSPEISLSIFRVLQEALQNAIKHSGSHRFEVSLKHNSNEIHLTVRDSGSGFDLAQALKGRGLGLTSMKERIALVDGELEIESLPQNGTTVCVRVPLRSAIPHADSAE
jgi:PAS domain S-box-containing protein